MSAYWRTAHAELISLANHTFSYPPHSHVSVYMIGVLLRDAMELRQGHENRFVHAGEWFVVPPYVVHSLAPRGSVDMLALCVHRDIALGLADISLMDAADEILSPLLGGGVMSREACPSHGRRRQPSFPQGARISRTRGACWKRIPARFFPRSNWRETRLFARIN
jgi:hypothetical protein